MKNQVVEVYSEAIFQLSKEKNKLDKHKEDFSYIDKIIHENQEIKFLIENPNILKDDKKNMLSKIFVDIDRDILNLLKILVDKSRFDIIFDLIRDFIKKYNKEKNIMEGIVYSSKKLDKKDIEDLSKALKKKFDKTIILKNEIDESLIGGVSIYIDEKRIDNSIKSRLDSLKSNLMKEGE